MVRTVYPVPHIAPRLEHTLDEGGHKALVAEQLADVRLVVRRFAQNLAEVSERSIKIFFECAVRNLFYIAVSSCQ